MNEDDCAKQYFRNLDTQFVVKLEEVLVEAETLLLERLKLSLPTSQDTSLGVKSRIPTATGFESTSQVFSNVSLPGKSSFYLLMFYVQHSNLFEVDIKEEGCLLEKLKLELPFLSKISKKSQKECTVVSSQSSLINWQQIRSECNSIISLIEKQKHSSKSPVNVKKQSSLAADNNEKNSTRKDCKKIGYPRPGKKLVILDVDHTIIDYHAPEPQWVARPYLQMFLEGIYEEFDIGIWSATEMNTALLKLFMLGMLTNPNYRILFCMSADAMTHITLNSKRYRVST